MYRTMDGTVLMAISQFLSRFPRTPIYMTLPCFPGMLLQEYVAHQLTPHVPDEWDEEMLQFEREGSGEDAVAGERPSPPPPETS
jgi:hypothetical protein